MQCAETLRTQAYFDGEIDAVAAVDVERHVEHCAECRALLESYQEMRTAIRRDLTHHHAPPELRAQIRRALHQETTGRTQRGTGSGKSSWRSRSFWVGAFTGVGSTAVAGIVAFFLLSSSLNPLLDELVAAHVRSLMPAHLIDVVSSDQHTVKPWFAGHADVSPVVADFAQQGYLLVGGRADYFDHRRAAVVVYRHGPHVINIFSWPSGQRAVPDTTTRSGYHMVFWQAGDLQYCAVSDTGWDELLGLVHLLQGLSVRDTGNNPGPHRE